ncbi:GDP/GTP exchange factor for ARF [Thecaphora frezii]
MTSPAGGVAAAPKPSRQSSRSATPSRRRRPTGDDAATPTISDFPALDDAKCKTRLEPHGLHLVLSEISSVTSAMRKNARWNAASYAAFSGLTSYSYASASSSLAASAAASSSASVGPVPSSSAVGSSSIAANVANAAMSAKTPADSASGGLSASMRLRANPAQRQPELAAAMARKPGYSTSSDGKGEDGVGLLSGFAVLRAQLRECQDISAFPLPLLLSPFLRVILSPKTTGPITSAALQSVHRFLVYGLVKLSSPGAQLAVTEIAHATSHCRFEASEASADELVLLRILAVMQELICEPSSGGGALSLAFEQGPREGLAPRQKALADCLSDDSICEMMETGLSMCCQMRLSNLLRRTAEQAMVSMLRSLFSRLASIPTTADEFYSADPDAPEQEPEHATLAAEPVGEDGEQDEKRRRRMTMPDPTSNAFPAAAAQSLKDLKAIGEVQEDEAQSVAAGCGRSALLGVDEDNVSNEKETEAEADAETETEAQAESVHLRTTEAREHEADGADLEEAAGSAANEVHSYGLPAVKEVLRVLVSLLDVTNQQHTDTMRLLGLSMLASVFEAAGRSIGRFPSLRAIVQDTACKHLFLLARADNTTLLSLSLRCISILFETMREHLKVQHEFFVNFLIDRLAPTFPLSAEPWNDRALSAGAAKRAHTAAVGNHRSNTPDVSAAPPAPPPAPPHPKGSDRAPAHGEARELLLETMALLFRFFDHERSTDYLVDLWINYDCDIDCDNLYEKMIHFLCRSIHATNPQHPNHQDSTQLFALDALLSFVTSMAARQEYEHGGGAGSTSSPDDLATYAPLTERKGKKAAILAGASRFNAKPKDGLAYLEREGLLDTSDPSMTREARIAKFLKECPRLDKKLLGDYLSRPDNIEVLKAFIGLFDFKDKPIAEAFREMLESFRLPGEAQQIDRITEIFAKTYFATDPAGIASEDAVYVLAFSIILLNTDLHNPLNKTRMSLDDYKRNLRGVNKGVDFDAEYLSTIYDSIRRREIVMPEEHAGQLGFDYAWKEILRRSRTAGSYTVNRTAVFDRGMFESSWKPIFSSIALAFSSFRDEYMVERAISGIRQCAILASNFGMTEIFDFMVHSLASATGLLDSSVPQSATTNATLEVEGQQITVSPLSVRFGVNFKGQLAAVVLFTIANGNGDAIRSGWSDIFEIFENLFANTLLPPPMLQMYDFFDGMVPIPLKPKKLPGSSPQDPRAQGGGLFSTLSSYLLSPSYSSHSPQTYEAKEEDVEATLCTVDCVASCRIEELYDQIQHLGPDSLVQAMHALRDLADALTVERLHAAEAGASPDFPSAPASSYHTFIDGVLPYDPKVVFALEMMVSIASGARHQIGEVWPIALDHVSAVLRLAKSFHPMLLEREVAALLRLLKHAAQEGELRDQLFLSLDLLRTLPTEVRVAGSKQLLAGLKDILDESPRFARSQTEWGLIFALIGDNANVRNADAARLAFEVVKVATVGQDGDKVDQLLTPDNFLQAVALLSEFASGADTTAWRNMLIREAPQRRITLTERKEMAEVEKVQQERGCEAVKLLEGFKNQVPRIIRESKMDEDAAWRTFWPPLLSSLSRQWTNTHSGVRQASIGLLQRCLLAPELLTSSSSMQLMLLFNDILFPMLEELLKPQVYQIDPTNNPGGMLETRIRACALVCKTLLHLMVKLNQGGEREFEQLWCRILELLDRMLMSGGGGGGAAGPDDKRRDPLAEAIPENLKNVLLVMSASDLLLPPPPSGQHDARTTHQAALWAVTFDRVQRFLPGLMEDVFPPPPPPPPAASEPIAAPPSLNDEAKTETAEATQSEQQDAAATGETATEA